MQKVAMSSHQRRRRRIGSAAAATAPRGAAHFLARHGPRPPRQVHLGVTLSGRRRRYANAAFSLPLLPLASCGFAGRRASSKLVRFIEPCKCKNAHARRAIVALCRAWWKRICSCRTRWRAFGASGQNPRDPLTNPSPGPAAGTCSSLNGNFASYAVIGDCSVRFLSCFSQYAKQDLPTFGEHGTCDIWRRFCGTFSKSPLCMARFAKAHTVWNLSFSSPRDLKKGGKERPRFLSRPAVDAFTNCEFIFFTYQFN